MNDPTLILSHSSKLQISGQEYRWPKDTWKDAQHHLLLEKCKSKLQRDITSHRSESVQFSSVAQSWLTICDPMNHSSPAHPVHHQLPEFTQTHVVMFISSLVIPFSSFPQSLPASVFSNESTLLMRWPKYWSFSFSISPYNKHLGWSPLEWNGSISLQSKGLSRVFSNTIVQKHQFFSVQLSSQSNFHIHTWPLEKR